MAKPKTTRGPVITGPLHVDGDLDVSVRATVRTNAAKTTGGASTTTQTVKVTPATFTGNVRVGGRIRR